MRRVNWVDSGTAGGRSVTSGQVSVDPTTGRIAFFRVDNGTFSVILDHGSRWLTLHNPNSTGFNYGAIDWTPGGLQTIVGQQHHSDGPPWVSFDGSATWANMPIGKRFGVIDATTLVRDCEFGIERSTDKGQTWTQVSTQQPLSRSVVRYGENYYWTSRDGVIVSDDKGATWSVVGNPMLGAVFGPYFGMNEQSMMVVSGNGFFITIDGGTTWTQATTFMTYYAVADGWDAKFNADGQHHFFSWDHRNNILYAAPSNGSAFKMILEESSTADVRWGVATQGARASAGLPGSGAGRCFDLRGRVAGPALVADTKYRSGVRQKRTMRLVVRER